MRICAYTLIFQPKRQPMQNVIKTMKALADETRLRIMKVLLERACCVCEIMQALDISQSRASRNLSILQDAGFLKTNRDGLWIVYSIDWQTANRYAISLANLLRDTSINNDILKRDKARLKRTKRIGPGCRRGNTKKNK
jgi:ArsR family transcriptional regulator